jgi:hypothetical protein
MVASLAEESRFAAVASDSPSFERGPVGSPHNDPNVAIHQWAWAGWGMPLGEMFDLEKLAEKCGELGRCSFFVSSGPLKVGRIAPSQLKSRALSDHRSQQALLVHPMLWPYSDD